MKMAKIATMIAATMLVALASARTEPNSFLNKPVETHAALMKQISSDPQVMNRFMRHFGMTRDEVINYFNTLKLDTLKSDGVYLVYNVPESEEIRARAIFYKKGTKVWVDQQGTLVLKASCGNPMIRGTDSSSVTVESPIEAAVAPVTATAVVPEGVGIDPVAQSLPMDVESSALAFPAAAPADITQFTRSSGAVFNPAFLLPLAAVPFIITTDDPPDSVPEPMTMVALAAGAGFIARKRRKNKN